MRIRMGRMKRRVPIHGLGLRATKERGVAAVEFALVLPILLAIVLGICDFGFFIYRDLQITHSARDAVRYLSLGDDTNATRILSDLEGDLSPQTSVDGVVIAGSPLGPCSVRVEGTYHPLTPFPGWIGIVDANGGLSIDVSATMRQGQGE